MRSYGQYCALARALDLVGERWTLLIIRELFSRDSRYSDLRDGLPGIASNLLVDRLRRLEADGIIESYEAPRPVGATVYRLTGRGRELRPVLQALAKWGTPLLQDVRETESFRTHWLTLALQNAYTRDDVADLAPFSFLIRTGDEPACVKVTDEGLEVHPGTPGTPDVVVEGPPSEVCAFLSGATEEVYPPGVTVTGPEEAVERLRVLIFRSSLMPASGGR